MNTEPLDDAHKNINRAIGEELSYWRNVRGWKRPQFVKLLKTRTPVNTYACYEQGIRKCSIEKLVEICEALDVSAPELLRHALQRVNPVTRCPTCDSESPLGSVLPRE